MKTDHQSELDRLGKYKVWRLKESRLVTLCETATHKVIEFLVDHFERDGEHSDGPEYDHRIVIHASCDHYSYHNAICTDHKGIGRKELDLIKAAERSLINVINCPSSKIEDDYFAIMTRTVDG